MTWGRVSFCFICISLVHCSGKLKSVDETLTSKKESAGNSPKRREDVLENANKAVDTAVNTAVTTPPTAAIPAIRVSNTCTVKVCSKQDGHAIDDPVVPHWYNDYLYYADGSSHGYFGRLSYYTDVPRWQEVTYCVTITQRNDKTLVASWFKQVPAGRLYWFVVGYAEYDEESKEEISKNKDACDGEIIMRWKYILDIFKTGDDFTDMPTENLIEDLKPSAEDSVVNTRSGKWKYNGKALLHMARWHARKAFWVIDATAVEFVDHPHSLTSNYDDAPFTTQSYVSLDFSTPLDWINAILTGNNVSTAGNKITGQAMYSFWNAVPKGSDYVKLMHQKEKFFDEHNKASANNEKSGAVFIKAFNIDSVRTRTSEKVTNKGPRPDMNGLQTRPLFSKVMYDDYRLRLAIVACGLFPKTMPVPKNCVGASVNKGESEG